MSRASLRTARPRATSSPSASQTLLPQRATSSPPPSSTTRPTTPASSKKSRSALLFPPSHGPTSRRSLPAPTTPRPVSVRACGARMSRRPPRLRDDLKLDPSSSTHGRSLLPRPSLVDTRNLVLVVSGARLACWLTATLTSFTSTSLKDLRCVLMGYRIIVC